MAVEANEIQRSLLVWSAFEPKTAGHGGNLRTLQLSELCREAGFSPQPIPRTISVPIHVRLARGLLSALSVRKAGIRIPPRSWSLAGYYATVIRQSLRAHAGARILLWEDTSTMIAPSMARQLGFVTIAAPQNLESLARDPGDLGLFRSEVAALAMADHVFCIAEEEAWLLADLGVKADFLPYYPPPSKRERLAAIADRRARSSSRAGPWLILGTAHNPPTRQGMEALLRALRPALAPDFRLVVAGHGTENLREKIAADFVDIRGPISDGELDTLVVEARGLLVHQDRGAGALSRIPEALIAGLPVVASRIAARSTRGYPGIHVYDTFDELIALLSSLNPTEAPAVPIPAGGSRFQAILRAAHRDAGP